MDINRNNFYPDHFTCIKKLHKIANFYICTKKIVTFCCTTTEVFKRKYESCFKKNNLKKNFFLNFFTCFKRILNLEYYAKSFFKNIFSLKGYSTLSKSILSWFLVPISVRWPKRKKTIRVKVVPLDVHDHLSMYWTHR